MRPVWGRGVPVETRAFTRPVSWRDIGTDYDVSRVFTQKLEVGNTSIVVMGDNPEELHEKVGAAMLGYWHSGLNSKKSLARVVHKSEVQSGCVPHHVLRPRPELWPSEFPERVS